MPGESPDIPPKMQKVLKRFERWRSAHTGRWPIPQRLWAAAVELAREHGVFQTAKILRLDYSKLKQLLESGAVKRSGATRAVGVKSRRIRSEAPPAFMELLASPTATAVSECQIELTIRLNQRYTNRARASPRGFHSWPEYCHVHWASEVGPEPRFFRGEMARIGERIRALREKLGLSQGEIERATGLFRAYISRVEHGHTIPSLESIERFAAALGARSMNCSLNPRRQKALP